MVKIIFSKMLLKSVSMREVFRCLQICGSTFYAHADRTAGVRVVTNVLLKQPLYPHNTEQKFFLPTLLRTLLLSLASVMEI